ncbi:MAG TPA: hypothetical protein VFX16_36120 [Pseudonocardiaceae bacterium]|nr:hypothetical protein [Pseudonocardiaceae bacterium]
MPVVDPYVPAMLADGPRRAVLRCFREKDRVRALTPPGRAAGQPEMAAPGEWALRRG